MSCIYDSTKFKFFCCCRIEYKYVCPKDLRLCEGNQNLAPPSYWTQTLPLARPRFRKIICMYIYIHMDLKSEWISVTLPTTKKKKRKEKKRWEPANIHSLQPFFFLQLSCMYVLYMLHISITKKERVVWYKRRLNSSLHNSLSVLLL